MTEEAEVLVERRGRLGLLTLNRPQALNALTHNMVLLIAAALEEWADDPEIQTVAFVGAGDRALCAGGDVVTLYYDVTQGDGSGTAAFWRDEYAMNLRVATYPKPVVAVQDGIVLGGGIGISGHASHRVVTERSRLGFPEVTIGFIPDVGADWLFTRIPGELGTRLALTGDHFGAGDAILIGFSDSYVPSERLPQLLSALEAEPADEAIAAVAEEAPAAPLAGQRAWIDEAFATGNVLEILARLRATGIEEAVKAADTIETKSPLAVAVSLEALRRTRRLPSLRAALEQDFRVARHISATHDFAEGIRAQLVDKDRNPQWDPPTHADVTAEAVAACFAPLPDGEELTLTDPSKETTP